MGGLCECDATLSSRWNDLACNDYTGGVNWGTKTNVLELPPPRRQLPPPGRQLPPPGRQLLPSARVGVSPAPNGSPPRVVVLTYANAPSKGICNLLQSTIHSQVPLTVLGWEPSSTRRVGMWYIQSKVIRRTFPICETPCHPRISCISADSLFCPPISYIGFLSADSFFSSFLRRHFTWSACVCRRGH